MNDVVPISVSASAAQNLRQLADDLRRRAWEFEQAADYLDRLASSPPGGVTVDLDTAAVG